MGQTLTHGVYLPDEGERNCYDGLASNWSILDGAVGTIAEHTTALAGKAPAVHTHTKSDVTDLLNSNFIPSANNSYDLGSSSYQWNNVYAKGYYYNGTAWGLDKLNVWSNDQVLEGINLGRALRLRKTTIVMGDPPPASGFTEVGTFVFSDKNNANFGFMNLRDYANGNTSINLLCRQRYTNGVRNTSGNNVEASLVLEVDYSTNRNFYPGTSNTHNLGTSTNKWKSFNGINPGALSLPDVYDGDPISTVGWSLTGARNTYTPTENGWFFIRVKGTASTKCSLNIHSGSYADNYPTWVSYNDPTISLSTSLVVPAQKSVNLYVYIIAAEIEQLIFYPCLGNV